MSAVEDWCRAAAKALDAKPWVQVDGALFTCLFCNMDWKDRCAHTSACRMLDLEALSRTIPKELLE